MKKTINFRLFKVANRTTEKTSPLFRMLTSSLEDGKKLVENRMMHLRENENSDQDVLGYFAKTARYIYGVMLRIANAKDVPELPTDFEKGENINIEEILKKAEENASEKKVCKSLYHFLITDDYIVTDLPKTRPITCFQDYINWLLMLDKDMSFSITPVIEPGKILMSQLKQVIFKDAFLPMPDEKKSGIRSRIDKFMDMLIEGDDLTMKKLHEKDIVSATLSVNFERPRKMEVNEYERMMSAILKTIDKPDNVVFQMNDKKQLMGSKMLFSRSETLENEPVIKDMDYIHAMMKIRNEYDETTKNTK